MGAILLVVGDAGTPTTGDAILKTTLESLGHTVTYRSDETAEDVTGFNGVVISESVAAATIASKYDTAAVPVITQENGNVDALRLTDGEWGNVNSLGPTSFQVLDSAHPIFAGPYGSFSGTVTIFSTGSDLGYIDSDFATFPAGVSVIAQHDSDTTQKIVLVANAGATLQTGTAPAKRAFIGLRDSSVANLNANGTAIIKNAYVWAFETRGPHHTGVLDNFNRADAANLGASYDDMPARGLPTHSVISSQVGQTGFASNYWLQQFGEDQEAWATVVALPDVGWMRLMCRLQAPDSFAEYAYWITVFDSGDWYLENAVNSLQTNTTLQTLGTAGDFQPGWRVGLSCRGNQISCYKDTGSGWEQVGTTVTDNSVTGPGYIGLYTGDTATARWDDFGGGSIASYATTVLGDNPAAYYRMDEASGQPQDSSGNGNHTTATGGTPTYAQTGAITTDPTDGAILLDGATEYFSAPDHATLDTGDTFSLEAWINRSGGFATSHTVLDKGVTGGPSYRMFLDDGTGQFGVELSGGGTICKSTALIDQTGVWYHLVFTKSGSTSHLYLDGVDVTGTVTNQTIGNTTDPLWIGAEAGITTFLDTLIDEVAIYPTALSSSQVLSHYYAGISNYAAEVLIDEPVAYYRMNEEGISPIEFDGSANAKLTLGLGSVSVAAGFTLVAVIRPKAAASYQQVIGIENAGGFDVYSMEIRDDDHITGNIDGIEHGDFGALTADKWYLVAYSKPSGASSPRGHVLNITDAGAWYHADAASTSGSANTPDHIALGEWQNTDPSLLHFAVAGIWNSVLTDAQIESLTNNLDAWRNLDPDWWTTAQGATPLVDLSGGGGNEISRQSGVTVSALLGFVPFPTSLPNDSSGNGNHTWYQSGAPDFEQTGAIETDPTDDAIKLVAGLEYFSAPDHATLDLGNTFSIEAWLKRLTISGVEEIIVSKFNGGYAMGLESTGNVIIAKSNTAVIAASTLAISDTTSYHHVVVTKDSSTISSIYIDGVDVTNYGTATDFTCVDTANELWIGSENGGGSVDGTLDEVAIYGTALSAARVLAHYEAAFAEEEALAEYVTTFLSAIGW